MNLVFSTIRDNLLTVNQSEIFNNSELICDEIWLTTLWAPWVNEHNGLVRVVSSAYKTKFTDSMYIVQIYIYIYIRHTSPCDCTYKLIYRNLYIFWRGLTTIIIYKFMKPCPRSLEKKSCKFWHNWYHTYIQTCHLWNVTHSCLVFKWLYDIPFSLKIYSVKVDQFRVANLVILTW